jgi:hypothetical protein
LKRLSDDERRDRHTSGAELQTLVVELASIYGWYWVHFRAGRTTQGWRVPVEGPLGRGWPDLVLVHPIKRRTLFVEIKRELGDDVTAEQFYVLAMLRAAGCETFVWRPSDLTEGRIGDALG